MSVVATAPKSKVKELASEIIRDLPEEATWDEMMHKFYLREELDAADSDFASGRVVSHEDMKKEFGPVL